jgi:PilZ domain
MPALARVLSRTAVIAVLQQDVPVRLVNISRSGCLLIAPRMLRVGTVGRLHIALDGTEYVGDVRVVRCEALPGPSCQVGVQLLWMSMAEDIEDDVPPGFRLRTSRDGSAN